MRKSLCRLLAKSVLLYLLIFLLRSITRFLLLEELKSVECLQPASRCCKEIADFVTANPDPLIPTNRKKRRSCCFWKWLWICESLFVPAYSFWSSSTRSQAVSAFGGFALCG
ncbi:guanine nucleotide-binding protein subunit gamma 4-like isoform X3 [Rosa rugosa]|uniref:guanine nucleotide-binding protein subunit gamma 4-like isoform X3 n=1 Tax=Rosa rugosa TaxID=74645 RepID=UPI002B408297|nr:guanine nucleotide-binding protein subunit gamma 4-like isoform X3 [Rosa rugosa]